ncbi:hypothetical protein PFY01_02915 [Brevundimonas vesicularis]|nr:hypothetical protein [Brevundimonas vesicularis]WBT06645.1 hypothetical protein PFY01_02915 [Brevundimonas vesicularis]
MTICGRRLPHRLQTIFARMSRSGVKRCAWGSFAHAGMTLLPHWQTRAH